MRLLISSLVRGRMLVCLKTGVGGATKKGIELKKTYFIDFHFELYRHGKVDVKWTTTTMMMK